MARMRLFWCGVLLLLGTLVFAQGTYRNNRIFVVPRPGPVVIDGELNDWDLSGEIFSYVSEPTKDAMNAYTAMMYDADALYISARIADDTPMKNRWDPAVNPDFGWDGDSFQMRLSLDPKLGYPINIGWGNGDMKSDALVHMTMWYFTDAKQPVLHCKYGMNYHDAPDYPKGIVPQDKFQAAYKMWPNGKGYTLEYRIPWTTLHAVKAYQAGDLAGSALQVQWSNADGTHLGPGNVVDLQRTVGFSYQHTGCWGQSDLHRPRQPVQIDDAGHDRRPRAAQAAVVLPLHYAEGGGRLGGAVQRAGRAGAPRDPRAGAPGGQAGRGVGRAGRRGPRAAPRRL